MHAVSNTAGRVGLEGNYFENIQVQLQRSLCDNHHSSSQMLDRPASRKQRHHTILPKLQPEHQIRELKLSSKQRKTKMPQTKRKPSFTKPKE